MPQAAKKKAKRRKNVFMFAPAGARSVIAGVRFQKDSVLILLKSRVIIPLDLNWHPRLIEAKATERKAWALTEDGYGVEWPTLRVTISVKTLKPVEHLMP